MRRKGRITSFTSCERTVVRIWAVTDQASNNPLRCSSCQKSPASAGEVKVDSERLTMCPDCWDKMLGAEITFRKSFADLKKKGVIPDNAPDRGICPGCGVHVGPDDRALLGVSFYRPVRPEDHAPGVVFHPKGVFTAMSLCERCVVQMIPGLTPRIPALVEGRRKWREAPPIK